MTTKRAMKRLLEMIVVAMLAVGTLQAQPTGRWGAELEDSDLPAWKAQWIWLPEDSDADMLLARKTFALPEARTGRFCRLRPPRDTSCLLTGSTTAVALLALRLIISLSIFSISVMVFAKARTCWLFEFTSSEKTYRITVTREPGCSLSSTARLPCGN